MVVENTENRYNRAGYCEFGSVKETLSVVITISGGHGQK